MRVWLIKIAEPLPTDSTGDRLLRTGLLADTLVRNGHDVLWWASSFDHFRKRHRSSSDERIRLSERYAVQLLHAGGYRRNVSMRRLAGHRRIAQKFRMLAAREPEPDLILCSMPVPELCTAAGKLAKRHGIPLVIDVRDLWPDALVDLAPAALRGLARLALRPMQHAVSRACAAATAICGITEPFVEWGVAHAGRPRSAWDREFPLAYSQRRPEQPAIDDAVRFWREQGLPADRQEFIICFFGTIGRHFEFETVFKAASLLHARGKAVRFVVCGDGPWLARCRQQAKHLPNVLMPGWANAAEIWTLMRMSAIGLAPYVSTRDFMLSIPNKPIEYLSAGLPIVSSLRGMLQDVLAEHRCGTTYRNGDARQLCEVLAELQGNPHRLAHLAQNAETLFRSRFVAEDVYQQMQDHLQAIAESRRHQRAA